MITLQGIPLFYPFIKNPCVIPGNPAMRMEGGKPTTETIAFLIFTLSILTCWDLFSNGFWTSYNRLFGTISHVYYEFKSSGEFVDVEYDYIENAINKQGKALLLYAAEDRLILFENQNVTELNVKNNHQKINKVAAIRTQYPYIEKKSIFIEIEIDSLSSILSQNFVSGEIQSNKQFTVIQDNITTHTKTIRYEHQYSPIILTTQTIDTADIETKKQKLKELKIKTLQLQETNIEYQRKLKEYNHLSEQEKKITDSLKNQTGYLRNRLETELISLKKQLITRQKPIPPSNLAKQEEIRMLEEEINNSKKSTKQTFSGYLQYPDIPEIYK
jgi:inner membrane protein